MNFSILMLSIAFIFGPFIFLNELLFFKIKLKSLRSLRNSHLEIKYRFVILLRLLSLFLQEITLREKMPPCHAT